MSENLPPPSELPQEISDRNYRDYEDTLAYENVRARFKAYELAIGMVDPVENAMNALDRANSHRDSLSIGPGDLMFEYEMILKYGITGKKYCVEKNFDQTKRFDMNYNQSDLAIIQKVMYKMYGKDSTNEEKLQRAGQSIQRLGGLIVMRGVAQDLHEIPDNEVDDAYAWFMFYHLDGKEREEALAEIIRVMRPYGCFTSSTSGANNKPKTRMFERAVGPYLRDVLGIDTQEPVPMNTGFTTEKSLLEIPPRFTNAYVHNQRAAMYVNDKLLPGSLGTYLKAFDANRTLFDPVPPLDAWNAAREAVVEPFIEAEIKETGVFKDYAERSVIIASNGTLDSGRLEAHGFMNAK